jgi:tetratricopeptide (TPR) repeat protein
MLRDSTLRDPREAGVHIRYGRALGEFGLFKAAYPQFHTARALAAGSAEPDYWLAAYLERQGRPQHAVPTLQRALASDSSYVPARLALADALLELGRPLEARVQLERVQSGPGIDARSLYNLACLRAAAGEIEGALGALERAVAAGYSDWAGLAADHDLDALRAEQRFRRLLAHRGR